MKASHQEYLDELLNSRITLTDDEIEIVEDYIQSKSKLVSSRSLNTAKITAAIRSKTLAS